MSADEANDDGFGHLVSRSGGVYIIAHGMKDDLPPVLGSDDSTAGLRRRR